MKTIATKGETAHAKTGPWVKVVRGSTETHSAFATERDVAGAIM